MTVNPAVFEILRTEAAPAADHALLTALRASDPVIARAIVDTLLARAKREGLLGLVELFHELDELVRRYLLERIDDLFVVLRRASQSRVEQVRLNVLKIIESGCAYRAAYLADACLHDRSARVRKAAADTLYHLADHLLRTSPIDDSRLDHIEDDRAEFLMADIESYLEDRRQVVSALEGGLVSFSMHLHPQVIEAAMWFVDDLGPRFWAVVSDPGSRASRVASNIISQTTNSRLAPFAMLAFSYGELRPHVVRAVSGIADVSFLEALVRQSWRMVQSKVFKGLVAVKELSCLQNGAGEVLRLSLAAQRCLPRWIIATGVSCELKRKVLEELLRQGDRQVRRMAAWALTKMRDEGATGLLRRYTHSRDPELRKISRYELAHRRPLGYPPGKVLSSLRATGDSVLDPDREAALPRTFERLWQVFDDLSDEEQRQSGLTVVNEDPSSWSRLSNHLKDSGASNRMRALRIVTMLGLDKEFAEQLYQLSYDPDDMVRSMAVRALGQLPGPVSIRVLRNALADRDVRVQANAVEAVEQVGGPNAVSQLLPKLGSSDNRVRANAVKVLLKLGVREAAEALLQMLQDPNRAHRISALWLVDHMGLFTVALRVMEMAASDDDVQVRGRASDLAQRLTDRDSGESTGAMHSREATTLTP